MTKRFIALASPDKSTLILNVDHVVGVQAIPKTSVEAPGTAASVVFCTHGQAFPCIETPLQVYGVLLRATAEEDPEEDEEPIVISCPDCGEEDELELIAEHEDGHLRMFRCLSCTETWTEEAEDEEDEGAS